MLDVYDATLSPPFYIGMRKGNVCFIHTSILKREKSDFHFKNSKKSFVCWSIDQRIPSPDKR